MSPSGAELLREIKSRIEEIDPSKVHELLDEGIAIIDVRETEEYGAGHLPGARHVPKSYLETRIEGVVPDRDAHIAGSLDSGDSLLRLGQPLRLRGAHAEGRARL